MSTTCGEPHMSATDDRARLDEIGEGNVGYTDALLARDEMDFLISLARDGLHWREAAAAEGEVEAAAAAYMHGVEVDGGICTNFDFRATISDTLTAAAAWRAANAPKDGEREALRAQVEMLREAAGAALSAVIAHTHAAPDSATAYEQRLLTAALAATEPKDKHAVSPLLWCCHVTGPDDIYATRDYEHARKMAQDLNYMLLKKMFADPSDNWPLVHAEPMLWPWDRQAHIEDLAKAEKEDADRAATIRAATEPKDKQP